MTDSLTHNLSRHMAQVRFEDLPSSVVESTGLLLQDTLAVGWAGSAFPALQDLRERASISLGGCDLWGTGQRASTLDAVFFNGIAAAALEFDSLHDAGLIHADLVCAPAVFATAQERRASGKELIAAMALATDVACRLALGATEHSGWWHTSIYGVFGAAAGCARLLGLNEAGIARSMGIALGHTGGTLQAVVEKADMKRVQSAIASHGAARSAHLALWGVSAPQDALSGRYGLFGLYEAGGDEGTVLSRLGEHFEGTQSSFKKFPTCGCGHAAIEAALQLKLKHKLEPAMVERIVIKMSSYMANLVGGAYEPDANPTVAAQFSAKYGVACVVLRGQMGLQEIEANTAMDETLKAFASRVEVEIDPSNNGKLSPAEVHCYLRDGQHLSLRVDEVPGGAALPMSSSDLRSKARDCVVRGAVPLNPSEADEWLQRLATLDACPDVSQLFAGLNKQL